MIISTQEPGPQMAKKKKSPVILNYRAFPFSSGPDGSKPKIFKYNQLLSHFHK